MRLRIEKLVCARARNFLACGRDLFDFNGTFSGAGHGTFVGPRAAGARLVGAPPQACGREKFDFSIFRHLCAYQLVLAGNRQYQPLECECCAAARTEFGCGVYYVNTTRRLLFVVFEMDVLCWVQSVFVALAAGPGLQSRAASCALAFALSIAAPQQWRHATLPLGSTAPCETQHFFLLWKTLAQ